MHSETVNLERLEDSAERLLRLLKDREESSGRNRAIQSAIIILLEVILTEQEIEVLKFFERNRELLRDLKTVKGVLRLTGK